jgi:hypothetical protein
MKYWPQWTSRVVTELKGRDPLGLSRVSDALTEFLLPGIITTTDRARYYSFYTWAIADIAIARKNAERGFSFEAEFQRREAAFALASRIGAKTDLSLVGYLKVREKLAEAEQDQTADTAFRVLPSNALGGFGNYYGGCLRGMELAGFDENGAWIVPEGRGLALAESFTSATRKAPYLAGDYRHRERVPLNVLRKSADFFSLDGLCSTTARAERGLLTELFFCLGQRPDPLAPLNRQATLGQLLHVLQSYLDAGLEVTRRNIDWAGVFWPHYYGCIAQLDGRPRRYEPPLAFAQVHGFWRQFCAHQFLAFALEELLAAVLDALVPYPDGLTETDLLDALVNDDFLDDITQTLGRKCRRPEVLLSALGVKGVPNAAASRAVVRQFGAAARLNDWAVCYDREVGPQTRLGRAVLLLALLYGKWRGETEDVAFGAVDRIAAKDLWIGTIFPWVDGWIGERLDWRTAVARLLDCMMRRHELVKFQKRKLEASWFEVDGGRWLKQQDIAPSFRASRHRNAVTILQDLALIEHSKLDEPLVLTSEGRRVLVQVTRLRT